MKKAIITGAIGLIFVSLIQGQGIDFFHGTFAEAVEKAKKEDKLVFMDAFAEWCGPCKRMAATVFKEEKVGNFFNQNFVNVKMDMEKGEGQALSGRFNVSAYPTLLFINGKGELVQAGVGGLMSEEFLNLAKNALSKADNAKDLEKEYVSGKREPDFMVRYVRSLNRSGKSSLKVVNDFLQKNPDFNHAAVLKVIYEGTTQADSKVFDLLLKHSTKIKALYSDAMFQSKIETACLKTLENAKQFKSEALLQEAKNKFKQNVPEKYDAFEVEADIEYYQTVGEVKPYLKACNTCAKKVAKNDANQLYQLAKRMETAFPKDKTVLTQAEKYASKAAENGGLVHYYYTYSTILLKNNKKKDALTAANKALELAKASQPQSIQGVENLILQIKG
jgi:thiol-disulfide isomerase/thioredoxin